MGAEDISHPPESRSANACREAAQCGKFSTLVGTAALVGLAAGGCGPLRRLTGPGPDSNAPLPRDEARCADAMRALNRAGFGPRPGDAARVAETGAGAWLEEQLADRMKEDPAVAWRVDALDVQQTVQDAPDALYSLPDSQLLIETEQAAILRAVYSRHQLRETLAD